MLEAVFYSFLTVHLICSKAVVLKLLESDWCHLDHAHLDTLGPLGHSLVLDTWLDSPIAYSASIYCPTLLHIIYMALKQICSQHVPEQFYYPVKQKSQIFC